MAYTNIDDPSAYFQTTTYTGAGANTVVTNGGNSDLKPDLLWIKNRTAGYAHFLVDSNRNISYAQNSSNAPYLETDSTAAENNNQNWMQSVNTDGFTTGIAEHTNCNSGSAYVAWQWKANGGTTVSNTDGNITSTVQSNTTAGFSIVTYTGNGTDNQTIGHGLGVQPSWWIVKRRDTTGDWWFGASSILGGTSNYLKLNTNAANAESNNIWGDSPTSSSVFRVSNNAGLNASSGTYVAYLFANKQGYSKFGSYVGNGNANGPFVYTGFKPAFVMFKRTNSTRSWVIIDNKRDTSNVASTRLFPDLTNADSTLADLVDFTSNGFKLRNTNVITNGNASTYIYMAFAENPFTTSTGVPTTAR